MARKSTIENLKRVRAIVERKKETRQKLKAIINNREEDPAKRFQAQLKLAKMPRNSSATRIRNRCSITGRARGTYRKFGISRIVLRDMVAAGVIPGLRKASW